MAKVLQRHNAKASQGSVVSRLFIIRIQPRSPAYLPAGLLHSSPPCLYSNGWVLNESCMDKMSCVGLWGGWTTAHHIHTVVSIEDMHTVLENVCLWLLPLPRCCMCLPLFWMCPLYVLIINERGGQLCSSSTCITDFRLSLPLKHHNHIFQRSFISHLLHSVCVDCCHIKVRNSLMTVFYVLVHKTVKQQTSVTHLSGLLSQCVLEKCFSHHTLDCNIPYSLFFFFLVLYLNGGIMM